MKVSAGPYGLEIPPNGVAILYEVDEAGAEHQFPGGVGYFEALIQFAGEVIRLNAEIVELRKLTDGDWVWKQITGTRDAALEEAATACLRKARDHVIPMGQDNYHDGCVSCAATIRALVR